MRSCRRSLLVALVLCQAACFRVQLPPAEPADRDMSGRDLGADTISDVGGETDDGTNDAGNTCGDGALQPTEQCDPEIPQGSVGACPSDCDDGVACTQERQTGAAQTCDLVCIIEVIDDCVDGDGCCPAACDNTNDADCSNIPVCGDGVVSGGETCDIAIASAQAGACPQAAECPRATCAEPRVLGSASRCDASCTLVPITTCADDDGCCAPGCDATSDNDCSVVCGDGVIDSGELCDGNCPTACDDGLACTADVLRGSAATCDAECAFDAITVCVNGDGCCPTACDSTNDDDCSATCGNGVVDAGETCDDSSPTACPTTCDDGDLCTTDQLLGGAANCNAQCSYAAVTSCVGGDGCCALGCNANNDSDCASVCGNGVTEGSETCDGNCPSTCDDSDACTTDTRTGSEPNCDVQCTSTPITACSTTSDGCCPTGCNAVNDADCGPVCGNGVIEGSEVCDGNCPTNCDDGDACTLDLLTGSAAQCSASCSNSQVNLCSDDDGCCPAGCSSINDTDCSASCGNNIVEGSETCDGDCPTQAQCDALGACYELTGSAGACTAECVMEPGCVECDLSGTCPCATTEACVAGRCESSGGTNCNAACGADAYCAAFFGGGYRCETTGNQCLQCLSDVDCAGHETCNAGSCAAAASCDLASVPDEWCVFYLLGNACQVGAGACYTSCLDNSDCGSIEFCDNGVCRTAGTCDQANDPNEWCGTGRKCVGSTCYDGCSTQCDCSLLVACSFDPMAGGYCDGPMTNCTQVCAPDRDAWCVANHGALWTCSGAGSEDGCVL